jgi:hypothetical protein
MWILQVFDKSTSLRITCDPLGVCTWNDAPQLTSHCRRNENTSLHRSINHDINNCSPLDNISRLTIKSIKRDLKVTV